jgi:hypothetical protein
MGSKPRLKKNKDGRWLAYRCNTIVAEKVWTGSYNCSKAAELSFENAVILRCEKIAKCYMIEFIHLFKNSEAQSAKLDWTSEWMSPFYDTHNSTS